MTNLAAMPDQHPPKDLYAPTALRQSESMRDAGWSSSRLQALAAQVLTQPPAAALPGNLTDEWLDLISRDLESALGEDAPQDIDAQVLAVPLALVVHILAGQHGEAGHAWSFEDLFDRLQNYRVEIALELLNRRTGVHSTPATMATIFKQREVIAELAFLPEDADK
jgi:hypothetical protein